MIQSEKIDGEYLFPGPSTAAPIVKVNSSDSYSIGSLETLDGTNGVGG